MAQVFVQIITILVMINEKCGLPESYIEIKQQYTHKLQVLTIHLFCSCHEIWR